MKTNNQELYIIELAGKRYEVRVMSGQRQVKAGEQWLSPTDFVDFLVNKKQWDQVCELAKFGYSKMGSNSEIPNSSTSHLDSAACSIGWFSGEAPKDGKTYVAMGRVVWSDDCGGGSIPFIAQVHYSHRDGWEGWLDDRNLAIAEGVSERVHIDYWMPLPNENSSASK